MAPRLPKFATQVQELGFDELIINLPREELAKAKKPIGQVRATVATDGPS
jgi:hypothetical protein